jgi:phosphoenolpyruvate synthase/pyruvate phosphate dikinase
MTHPAQIIVSSRFSLFIMLDWFKHPYSAISGLPVTGADQEEAIEDIVKELCAETGADQEEALARIEKLSEVNPMLGFRGCRLVFILRHYL